MKIQIKATVAAVAVLALAGCATGADKAATSAPAPITSLPAPPPAPPAPAVVETVVETETVTIVETPTVTDASDADLTETDAAINACFAAGGQIVSWVGSSDGSEQACRREDGLEYRLADAQYYQ